MISFLKRLWRRLFPRKEKLGWHYYTVVRAYKPVNKHHIIPILYKKPNNEPTNQ